MNPILSGPKDHAMNDREPTMRELSLLSDIRVAAGDPYGKLMQYELVHHIRSLRECADTLRKIAAMPRRTKEQRLAKACVVFCDAMIDAKPDSASFARAGESNPSSIAPAREPLRVTIGVDPGICGAFAILHDGEPRSFFDMPTVPRPNGGNAVNAPRLAALLRGVVASAPGAHVFAILEPPSTRPGESPTSGQRSGESYGVIKGVLAALGVQWCEVRSQKWKKHFSLIKTEKDVARQYAMQRFPRVSQSLCRKKDNGRADALLIGCWGCETEQHAIAPGLF